MKVLNGAVILFALATIHLHGEVEASKCKSIISGSFTIINPPSDLSREGDCNVSENSGSITIATETCCIITEAGGEISVLGNGDLCDNNPCVTTTISSSTSSSGYTTSESSSSETSSSISTTKTETAVVETDVSSSGHSIMGYYSSVVAALAYSSVVILLLIPFQAD